MAWPALFLVSGAFLLFGASAVPAELAPVRVFSPPQYNAGPTQLALNSELLAREGLRMAQAYSSVPFRTLLLNGDIDVVVAPLSADLVESLWKKHAYWIVAERGVSTAVKPQYHLVFRKDVRFDRGNPFRIAVRDPRRSPDYLFLLQWLKAEELLALRPWFLNMSPQESIVALKAGAIEAAVLNESYRGEAQKELGDRVTVPVLQLPPHRLHVSVLLFSTAFLQNRHRDAVAFLRAYREGLSKARGSSMSQPPDLKTIQLQIDAFARLHQIPQGLKAETIVDPDLMSEASSTGAGGG